MSEALLAGLRELAGPELYRRNAFRVTGLPVDVDRPTARRQQQRLAAALQVGADIDGLGGSVDPEEVRAAFDVVLGDPRRRLVHEIFASWGAPAGCGCPESLHVDHDLAVQAHADALDLEPAEVLALAMAGRVDDGWATAAAAWTRTLRSAAFWRHLHHRVEQLDDRQLDGSSVDVLRAELPTALVQPLLQLAASAPYPAPFGKSLADWPVPDRDRLVEEAAGPQYAALDALIGDLHTRLDSGDAEGTVARMHAQANPALARLEGLAPLERHRRTATVRNRLAVLLNNCALAQYGQTGRYEGEVRAWLGEAQKLATDPETVRRIRENRDGYVREERDLRDFRAKVEQLRRAHGRHATAQFLRTLLHQTSDAATAAVIREMLAEVDATGTGYHQPSVRPLPRAYGVRRPRWRLVGSVAVCALLLLFCVLYQRVTDVPDAQRVNFHQPERGDNPAVVACVAEADDWRDGDSAVAVVDCGEEHWAEVVAYLPLVAASAEYPGVETVSRLARFTCLQEMAQFFLSPPTYEAEVIVPDAADWDELNPEANYATCAGRRADDEPLKRQAAVSNPVSAVFPVPMPLTSRRGSLHNAPVGYCVQSTQPPDNRWDEALPIVHCEEPHWAQILGYPHVTGPWPDEDAVAEEAGRACRELTGTRQLPERYTVTAAWPPWWNDASPPDYVACLAHHEDDHWSQGGI
ncbi:septum formation family protein [Micromonospora sp. NPDC048909]|uniref:septum formation family protein n=1 Tax=Micromonospora sp. NPDC048909 TaxID=3155643 RepID=UPI003400A02A